MSALVWMKRIPGSVLTAVTVAIATVLPLAKYVGAQVASDGRSTCYLKIEGRTIQDLSNLCGQTLPSRSNVTPSSRASQGSGIPLPAASPVDSDDSDLTDESATISPKPSSSTIPTPAANSSPTAQPSPLIPPPPASPSTPFPPTTVPSVNPVAAPTKPAAKEPSPEESQEKGRSKRQSAQPKLTNHPPTKVASKTKSFNSRSGNLPFNQAQSNRSHQNKQTFLPTKLPPANPQSPLLNSAPQALPTSPALSVLNIIASAKYFYIFTLLFVQIPLLKVVTKELSKSKNNASKPNAGIWQSAWQQLKQQPITRDSGLQAAGNEPIMISENLPHSKLKKLKSVDAVPSAWQQLKQQQMSCEAALELLVNQQGVVNLELLDREVSHRFLRHFPEQTGLLPVIPLLLWRNCYYLGSPIKLSEQAMQLLKDRLSSSVKIIPIAEKSFRQWSRVQNLQDNQRLTGTTIVDLAEPEDITEVAEYHLSQVDNQVERIKALIASALRNRASDIHLAPAPDGLRVRFRIDGILRHVTTLPAEISRRVIVSLKVMCDMDISESRRPQDGRISEKYVSEQQEEGLDLRVSTVPCVGGMKGEAAEKAVLRLLRQKNSFATVNDLGFSDKSLEIYQGWLREPQGMVILTGPTGSGKTSTLYTSLQAISTESVNIITVEDPVEYVLPGITQIQVHETAGMTFAAGLRAILRQDPDIIMLGEIRDAETAETATRAALTGHLVLTTLHTNDAIGAIPRLKDMGLDPGLISDALLGVIAQRLVRKVCPHCAEPYKPSQPDLAVLGIELKDAQPHNWRRGKGCPHCFNTGYLGREAIIELLNLDNTMRQIIHEGTTIQLQRYLKKIQFESFRSAAIAKVTAGVTTLDEVRRVLPYSVLGRELALE